MKFKEQGFIHKYGRNWKDDVSYFKRKLFTLTSTVSKHHIYFGNHYFSLHSFFYITFQEENGEYTIKPQSHLEDNANIQESIAGL